MFPLTRSGILMSLRPVSSAIRHPQYSRWPCSWADDGLVQRTSASGGGRLDASSPSYLHTSSPRGGSLSGRGSPLRVLLRPVAGRVDLKYICGEVCPEGHHSIYTHSPPTLAAAPLLSLVCVWMVFESMRDEERWGWSDGGGPSYLGRSPR